MLVPNQNAFRRALKFYIEGSRGGATRLRILLMLEKRPSNINEISRNLSMDYKTIQHHMRVMERSNLIASSGKRYGNAYMLSTLLSLNKEALRELKELGKSK